MPQKVSNMIALICVRGLDYWPWLTNFPCYSKVSDFVHSTAFLAGKMPHWSPQYFISKVDTNCLVQFSYKIFVLPLYFGKGCASRNSRLFGFFFEPVISHECNMVSQSQFINCRLSTSLHHPLIPSICSSKSLAMEVFLLFLFPVPLMYLKAIL